MIILKALRFSAHRLPANFAIGLLALLKQLVPAESPVLTVDEIRYLLMDRFKKHHTHNAAANLAIEALKGTPYGGVDWKTMFKSYTAGKRLQNQKWERQRRLNQLSVEE
jgi:hypothetical protein